MNQQQQLNKKTKVIGSEFLKNRGEHYAKIQDGTQNYWSSYYKDCLLAAERECLRSGNYSVKS